MRFDVWGIAMPAIGMGALQILLDKGQEDDWFGSRFMNLPSASIAVTPAAGVCSSSGFWNMPSLLRQLGIDLRAPPVWAQDHNI
jgi:hypothetical protein